MSQGSLENNRNHCNSTKVRMKNKTTCGKKTSDVELLTFALRLAPSRVDFLKHFFLHQYFFLLWQGLSGEPGPKGQVSFVS